jgi:hypothetical protein
VIIIGDLKKIEAPSRALGLRDLKVGGASGLVL